MRLALIFVCVVALARNGTAQSPSPEKAPAQASLEGKVVKEPAAEPLKKAIIELIGENQEESGNYTATSDQDGHFKIVGIHPGRYRLFVERTGYIEVDAKRRHSEGVVLSLEAGQELKDQTLHMLAAAIITGRVMDEDGDPMANVDVTLLRRKFSSGNFKFEPAGSSPTNDLGEYRIGGLMAGKYYISASPLPNFQSIVHVPKTPDDSETGQPDMAYVTTFYPNTADRSQASAIELHAGDDLPLDFSLTRTHTARIRGSVAGLIPGTKAVVMLRGRDSNAMYNASEADPDGKFEILHVAPGSYGVTAITLMTDPPQTARGTVEVTDTNVDGLRLVPLAGTTVRGRVRLAGSIPKVDASLLFMYLRRSDGENESSEGVTFADEGTMVSAGMGRVKADGTFELKNVPPGGCGCWLESEWRHNLDRCNGQFRGRRGGRCRRQRQERTNGRRRGGRGARREIPKTAESLWEGRDRPARTLQPARPASGRVHTFCVGDPRWRRLFRSGISKKIRGPRNRPTDRARPTPDHFSEGDSRCSGPAVRSAATSHSGPLSRNPLQVE